MPAVSILDILISLDLSGQIWSSTACPHDLSLLSAAQPLRMNQQCHEKILPSQSFSSCRCLNSQDESATPSQADGTEDLSRFLPFQDACSTSFADFFPLAFKNQILVPAFTVRVLHILSSLNSKDASTTQSRNH